MPTSHDRLSSPHIAPRRLPFLAAACLALVLASLPAMSSTPNPTPPDGVRPDRIPLAAIGDSNTLSYQDSISHPPQARGGALRKRTLNWGEVIDRLRGNQVDQGPWEISGVSNPRLRLLDTFGIPVSRAPRKEDFRYNFANNGAGCDELMVTRRRQIPRLVDMMDEDPQRWEHGVVVIRIGLANLAGVMGIQAATPQAPAVLAQVDGCLERFREAMKLIRKHHHQTHVVLVGLFEDSNDASNLEHWQSAREINNIARMFDMFDNGLRDIVAHDPNASFFDDRAWFRGLWGSRDAQGKPAYRTVAIGPTLRVTNTIGDTPDNAMLADDHNGLVWNVLWAQAMVRHLHDVAKLPVTPIGDDEIERFLRPLTD
ncbi:MAG: SGNH/GDSL hydrolase family protein [Proteobacteria bacterium]|nr:SGNH/GDSL hydrolase family protein [Pseudomonadota bacterium]